MLNKIPPTFYANDDINSKNLFVKLSCEVFSINNIPEIETETMRILLGTFGIRDFGNANDHFVGKTLKLEGDADPGEHAAQDYLTDKLGEVQDLFHDLTVMTFHYKDLREELGSFDQEGFDQHYITLFAFYFTRLTSLYGYLDSIYVGCESYLNGEGGEAVSTLKSLDDLWSIQIDCFTSGYAIRELSIVYFKCASALGLHLLKHFRKLDCPEIFNYWATKLEGTETSPEPLFQPLAHLDRISIFKKWYEETGTTPYSLCKAEIVNNVSMDVPLILDGEAPSILSPTSLPDLLGDGAVEAVPKKPEPEKIEQKKPEPKKEPKEEQPKKKGGRPPKKEALSAAKIETPEEVSKPEEPSEEKSTPKNFLEMMAEGKI